MEGDPRTGAQRVKSRAVGREDCAAAATTRSVRHYGSRPLASFCILFRIFLYHSVRKDFGFSFPPSFFFYYSPFFPSYKKNNKITYRFYVVTSAASVYYFSFISSPRKSSRVSTLQPESNRRRFPVSACPKLFFD